MLVSLTVLSLAWGAANDDVEYVRTLSHNFKPRKAPAKIASDDAKTLEKQGYFQLGSLSAFYPTKEGGEKEAPRKLEEMLLKEAASRGGDVVVIEAGNVAKMKARYKRGACKELHDTVMTRPTYRRDCLPDAQGHEKCMDVFTGNTEYHLKVCSEWEQVPLPSVPGLTTTATVWRRLETEDRRELDGELPNAASSGQVDLAKVLLQWGAAVEAYDGLGRTALQEAVAHHNIEMVKLLLDHGADPNSENPQFTPSERKCGKTLCEGGKQSPLIDAAWNGDMEIASLLIERRADVNQAEICKTRLYLRPDCHDGLTPLMAAAFMGRLPMLKLLVSRGARLNEVDRDGETALDMASRLNEPDAVKALLALGAQKPEEREFAAAAYKGDLAKIQALLQSNPSLVLVREERNGLTPLHLALFYGENEPVVEFLLAHNADVNARSNDGRTPLQIAAYQGSRVLVELLLAHNVDVNAKNDKGYTPLHWAAKFGNGEAVQVLLAHHADVNAKDNEGFTPLHYAAIAINKGAAELLRRHGGHE